MCYSYFPIKSIKYDTIFVDSSLFNYKIQEDWTLFNWKIND